jgi:hypothetical protein
MAGSGFPSPATLGAQHEKPTHSGLALHIFSVSSRIPLSIEKSFPLITSRSVFRFRYSNFFDEKKRVLEQRVTLYSIWYRALHGASVGATVFGLHFSTKFLQQSSGLHSHRFGSHVQNSSAIHG